MIKKARIINYKQFKDLKIEFNDDCNIIIGNNEAGKTSLLEAINLALTAKLYGRNISQELSPYLFNKDVQTEYIEQLRNQKNPPLPKIYIELYFDKTFTDSSFKGRNNLSDEDCAGVYIELCFDNEFQEEYLAYIEHPEEVNTIPVEYYKYKWYSFAGDNNKFTRLPMKAHLINNIEHRYNQGADKYIASLIEYSLEKKQNALLTLKYRKLKEEFADDNSIKEVNSKFSEQEYKISDKETKISIDTSAKNSWDSNLSLYLDDVPFKFIGKGEQNSVKTKLAIKANVDDSNLIMIEEPETSLSFSNLNKLTKHIKDACIEKQLIINTHSSYIMNKTGIEKTILLNGDKCFSIKDLDQSTYDYFKKLPGYDTLRMILSKKAILVEGPSDELIVQKAYLDKYDKLAIEDGIDVISVRGLAFKRFLNIAKIVGNEVIVITDNDGDLDALNRKYADYEEFANINISSSPNITLTTLEPNILECNDIKTLKTLFNKTSDTDSDFADYFQKKSNKTEVALKIFESTKNTVTIPGYITDVI